MSLVLLAFLLPFLFRFAWFVGVTPGDGRNIQVVELAKGRTLASFAAELEQKRLVSSARLFTIYARLMGADAKAQAGAYQLSDGMRPGQILARIKAGDVYLRLFALPEGYSIYQIAELLQNRGFFNKDSFLRACKDKELLAELEIPAGSVEGYLYPGTYNITPGLDEAGLIRQMVEKSDELFEARYASRLDNSSLDRNQLLTLASMVEKEAVEPSEKPLISSVFLNRLRIGMPLQSDPTSIYGVRAFAGKISKRDVQRPSPYNTYRIPGLPPGPIGNPGSAAIEAVLNPAPSKYLYFVARKDGTHFFSTTLAEHNRGVAKYLKASVAENGK